MDIKITEEQLAMATQRIRESSRKRSFAKSKTYIDRLTKYLDVNISFELNPDVAYEDTEEEKFLGEYLDYFLSFICNLAEQQNVPNKPDKDNIFQYNNYDFVYNRKRYNIWDMQGQGTIINVSVPTKSYYKEKYVRIPVK